VVKHLESKYGYVVTMIVSHSRGSGAAMRYLCTHDEVAANVRWFVNVSGRYRMRVDHEKLYPGLGNSFKTLGYYEFQATIAREPRTIRIYPHQVENYRSWDTSIVWDRFPIHTHVLTIHGIQDPEVPVYDAVLYSRALGLRSPGTHNLCLIEDADHNFTRPGVRSPPIPAPEYVFDLFSRIGKWSSTQSWGGMKRLKKEDARLAFGKLGYGPGCRVALMYDGVYGWGPRTEMAPHRYRAISWGWGRAQ